MPREYAPLGQPRCAPPVFSKSGKRKREERKISFFGKHLVEKSIRTRVKSYAFDKRKPSASRTVCTVAAARKKEYLRTNRQLRAAPREQLRYVVIISIWSYQCHRVVPRSERVDLKRRSKIAKNRDEKMIRAKSNRVEFPPYEADGRFVEDDTRTTDTRAPTHASTCHVGNDALPFDPRDRNIFSPPLVFARDNATTRFDRVRFYTGQSHPLFASAAEKSIDAMDFATRSFPTSSSSFARSLSVTGHSYAIIFRGCSAPRPVCTLCRRWNVVPLLEDREKRRKRVARDPRLRNLLHRAIFAPVNFSLEPPTECILALEYRTFSKIFSFLLYFSLFAFLLSFFFLSSIEETRRK